MTSLLDPERRSRLHMLIASAVVGLIPWFVLPGRIVADTKIDLVVDPWHYLARSTSAWDPEAFFGQLQNQAYGYLFPMGPFFGVTRSLGIPEWACQRLWWSLLLIIAFTGMYALVRRWGIAGNRIAILVAIAYALSPRALTVLGSISVEAWPAALVPWLLIWADRLLTAGSGPSRRRSAAVLGLLVVAIGGVNATATIAALAVPSLYLLSAGRAGVKPFAWWAGIVAFATAWWTIPLFVLGSYAFPFLDFIENSATTTRITSIPNVLRGASHWIAYVPAQGGGEWPAGALLATSDWLVLVTMALAVIGVIGLLRRPREAGLDHVRRFAIVSIVFGVAVMSLGFGGNLDGPFVSPFAGDIRSLLDGSLAAFRNVHKFDPLVRLPICLGFALVLATVPRLTRQRQTIAYACAVSLVAVAVSPAVQQDLAPRGSFPEIPERWYAASKAVDQLASRDGGKTLLAPATRYGSFTWGTTQDNPLEVLADSEIVNRAAIPLGNPGAIRVMDALDGKLTSGAGDAQLIDLLDRLGIARVVVARDQFQHLRNEVLEPTKAGTPRLTENALRASGLRLVKTWGKGAEALSLWSTDRTVDRVELYDRQAAQGLTGGPEAMIGVAEAGELGSDAPAYILGDGPGSPVQTDTLKKRFLSVAASVRDEYSATLQAGEDPGTGRVADDFPPAGSRPGTVREFRGITRVKSSSTAANPYSISYRGGDSGIASAFDADFGTSWLSADGDPKPAVRFALEEPTLVGSLQVRLATGDDVGRVREIVVDTGEESVVAEVDGDEPLLTIPVNATITSVRVRLVREDRFSGQPVGIANLSAEGLSISTGLRLPEVASDDGPVVLRRDEAEDGRVLTRFFSTRLPEPVRSISVSPRQTTDVERLVDGWKVSGPRINNDFLGRPGAALDDDPATRWTVGYLAGDPQLSIDWGKDRTVTGIDGLDVGDASSAIRQVTVTNPDTGESRPLDDSNERFPPLEASRVVVTLQLSGKAAYPFKVPDFTLTGAGRPPASRPSSIVRIPCSQGAQVSVGGLTAVYTASATRLQLAQGSPISVRRCAGVESETTAGDNALTATSSPILSVETVLVGSPADATSSEGTAEAVEWKDGRRVVEVETGDRSQILALHEGFNTGWTASAGGKVLEAIEVDGWRQGYVLPAETSGDVVLTFSPDRTYRGGLVVGGLLVLLLVVLALWPAQPSGQAGSVVTSRPWRHTGRVAGALIGVVLGGAAGLAVGLVAVVLPRPWRIRSMIGAGIALILTTVEWVVPQDGSLGSFVPQALGLFLLCGLAAELGTAVDERQDRRLHQAPREV